MIEVIIIVIPSKLLFREPFRSVELKIWIFQVICYFWCFSWFVALVENLQAGRQLSAGSVRKRPDDRTNNVIMSDFRFSRVYSMDISRMAAVRIADFVLWFGIILGNLHLESKTRLLYSTEYHEIFMGKTFEKGIRNILRREATSTDFFVPPFKQLGRRSPMCTLVLSKTSFTSEFWACLLF